MKTPARSPWVIIGCGKGKRSKPTAAADLYTGSYIRNAVSWARSVTIPRRILILSAKHGLIRGSKVIGPYMASFATTGFAAAAHGEPPVSNQVIAEQITWFGLEGPVITLAGDAYKDRLIAASGGTVQPYNPFFPVLDRLGYDHRTGYQAQQMKKHYGRMPNERTPGVQNQ